MALALALAVGLLAATPNSGRPVSIAASQVLLGEWTVRFIPSSLNAWGKNIRRPAAQINGTVIQPGGVFDFFKLTGPYTRANGYFPGGAIVGGEVKPDGVLGGGLCSAATALFNAAVRSGLDINKRTNHRFYISRYPVGLDATIWVSGGRAVHNVKFTNDMPTPIRIKSFSGTRYVTFQVWGYKDGRKTVISSPTVTNIRLAGTQIVYSDDVYPGRKRVFLPKSDGFTAVLSRTIYDKFGNAMSYEVFKSNYSPETGQTLLGRYPGDPPAGTIYKTITPPPTTPPPPPPATPTPPPTPTPKVTPTPTASPTAAPTATPTEAPTEAPTAAPTEAPTAAPTEVPTAAPTEPPTAAPTDAPTDAI